MKKLWAFIALCVTAVAGLSGQAPAAAPGDEFYLAIRSGDTARVSALLQGGADVNAKDRRGAATPLMHAAAIGTLDTLRLLLDKGADVNAKNSGGATALMWAVSDLAKIRLLVERGADVNIAANSGRTALFLAAMSDESSEAVGFLLARGASARITDEAKMTTLNAAAYGNDLGSVRQLVDAGVDVNAAEAHGITPLMNAAVNGNLESVKLLLARGAAVDAVSGPPFEKVQNGTVSLGHFTALSLAATGPADVVKALLSAGASPDVADSRGMTAAMFAVATDHGELETVKALIARGADLGVKDSGGATVLDWAKKSGPTPFVAALTAAHASSGQPVSPLADVPPPAPVAHRQAVERGISLLERSSGTFFVKGACGACHAQNVTDFATMAARRHGVPIGNEAAAQRANGAAGMFGSIASRLLEREDGPAVDIPIYTLASLAAANYPADRATDALVFNVAAQQQKSGRWHLGGPARPPIEDGDVSRTALALHGLQVYGLPGRGVEMRKRTARAVAWLQSFRPRSTDDLSFRLLGLMWGGADVKIVRQVARDLAGLQRSDGGWGQHSEMGSDAYATGLALYALIEGGGLSPSDPAVSKGRAYLLSTQRADGSWYVKSRSPKFQPYFEGGFPYGHDQWISAMATGWSTAALALALEKPSPTPASR